MLELGIPNLLNRITLYDIWQQLPTKLPKLEEKQEALNDVYTQLMNSQYLLKILGMILGIGNIVNANLKDRNRADGFELEMLTKVTGVRNNEKQSLLQYVCAKLHEQDGEDFTNFIKEARQMKLQVRGGDLSVINKEY